MDVRQSVVLAVGVGVGLLTAAAAYKLYVRSSQMKNSKQLVKGWKACGVVSQIHIFPIKSCQGTQVDEADAREMGLVNGELQDRSFMVVNENNNFLHARIHPTMLLIKVSISENKVELTAPSTEPITFPILSQSWAKVKVRVWGDEVTAFDCGDQAAQWLSQYILQKDSGARLVHLPYPRVSPRPLKTKSCLPWMRKTDGAVFTDLTPYHLLSTESVQDLNSRLPDGQEISTLNFRPTITISGCQPYEEDEWRFIRIGEEAVFRYVKGCDRCLLTTIDPATGIKDAEQEPLRTLRKYRLAEDPGLRRAIGESPSWESIYLWTNRAGSV